MSARSQFIEPFRERPRRSLGQNFLVDGNVARRIVDCLEPSIGEDVLEIGPGRGILTGELVSRGGRPLVLEKDLRLAQGLKSAWPEIGVVAMDAMDFDWSRLVRGAGRRIIGNLPYNIASPLIWRLVGTLPPPFLMVFTVQREVADRLTARPGSRIYGGLSVWVQSFAGIRREFNLGPEVFRPRPRVDSAVVSLRSIEQEARPPDPAALRRLIHRCFQKRRKQLGTILNPWWTSQIDDWLAAEALSPEVRPERLSPSQFKALSLLIK